MRHAIAPRDVHVQLIGCNGVPSACYEPLLRRLENHGVSTSTTEIHDCEGNWFRAYAKVENAPVPSDRRLVGFGHSMGGTCLLRAAQRTRRYDQILLWDPPLFGVWSRLALRLAQATGVVHWAPTVRKWRRRRSDFGSRDEVRAYVESKEFYRRFHPDVLAAFLALGVRDDGSWVFSPADEARFFVTTPTDLVIPSHGVYAATALPEGVLWISTEFEFLRPRDARYLAATFGKALHIETTDQSHFHPLHDPDDLAARIIARISLSS